MDGCGGREVGACGAGESGGLYRARALEGGCRTAVKGKKERHGV